MAVVVDVGDFEPTDLSAEFDGLVGDQQEWDGANATAGCVAVGWFVLVDGGEVVSIGGDFVCGLGVAAGGCECDGGEQDGEVGIHGGLFGIMCWCTVSILNVVGGSKGKMSYFHQSQYLIMWALYIPVSEFVAEVRYGSGSMLGKPASRRVS